MAIPEIHTESFRRPVRLPKVDLCFSTPGMDELVAASVLATFMRNYHEISHQDTRTVPSLVEQALNDCKGIEYIAADGSQTRVAPAMTVCTAPGSLKSTHAFRLAGADVRDAVSGRPQCTVGRRVHAARDSPLPLDVPSFLLG